ncbi:hypothetical protein ACFX2G_006205 [Malus domestica]
MPLVIFVLLLHVLLFADLKHSVVFHLHLHLILLQPHNVRFEHVGFGGLLPVDCSVHKSRFSREKSGNAESDEEEGNGKSLKWSHKLRENWSKMLLPC